MISLARSSESTTVLATTGIVAGEVCMSLILLQLTALDVTECWHHSAISFTSCAGKMHACKGNVTSEHL